MNGGSSADITSALSLFMISMPVVTGVKSELSEDGYNKINTLFLKKQSRFYKAMLFFLWLVLSYPVSVLLISSDKG
ncbi:hypothetical protein CJK33_21785 [Salmonella enterica subsp. enterica serovar Newport]|nr:hypothetical protein [Salmonella enterica subsp. enterica serovar Newport]